METLLEWAIILHDEISGVVWYCAKNAEIFPVQIFFTKAMKIVSFQHFDHFYLKMMKIIDIVHFLKPNFITTRNKPPSINTPHQCANWM